MQLDLCLAISDLELWARRGQSLFSTVTTRASHLRVCHILKPLRQIYLSDAVFYLLKTSKQTPVTRVLDENVAAQWA